jgi:hypothetical protein
MQKKQNGIAILFLKPLLGLFLNSQKCWYSCRQVDKTQKRVGAPSAAQNVGVFLMLS